MASDPRFNFYPDNYEGGTEFFSLEEDGAYLRLLMLQFRRGQFTEKEAVMKLMQRCPTNPEKAKSIWVSIKDKFEHSEGYFWNTRLRLEIEKSKQFSGNQAERAKIGWEKRKAESDATAVPSHTPETCPDDASNSISNSSNNTNSKTSSKKNTANADVFILERKELISELNGLAGRDFDPDAQYFRKEINARIKQYGVPDLIDMIRFIVFKRKGSDFEQYLKPDTIFQAKKCASYMVDMKHHRNNGLMPKKDARPSNGPKTSEELMEEIRIHRLKKQQL